MEYVLGLDLGTTSIGWAVAELGEDERPKRLIDANSRIFLSMVDAEKKEPKNKNRRIKRGMRKLVKRYKLRRDELIELLTKAGFIDAHLANPALWERELNSIENPYRLRARAVEPGEHLSELELFRVFLHLLKRRGYKSNRGAKFAPLLKELNSRGFARGFQDDVTQDEPDDGSANPANAEERKEAGLVLSGIGLLEAELENARLKANAKTYTVAQLIVDLADQSGISNPMRPHTHTRAETSKKGKSVQRHLYVTRELIEREFDLIWEKQAWHHQELMTTELKINIHRAIFHQRPLRSQRGRVGMCSLVITKARAAKASLESQEFLVLDDLNKITYTLPRQEGEFTLSSDQRREVLAALADERRLVGKNSLSWGEIKKLLRLPKAKFNLERTSKNGLYANRTYLAISRVIPAKWLALGQAIEPGHSYSKLQSALVQDLILIEDKVALFNRLTNHYGLPIQRNPWRFTPEEAFALVTLELADGYIKHCSQVVNRMLPFMRGGALYSNAVQAAGYLRKDQKQILGNPQLGPAPEIANPVVQKALFEMRRVMNDLIRKYGKPKFIRLEMAREMKASKAHRAEMDDRNKKNRKANDDAASEIRALASRYPDLGIRVSREAIVKYRLWLEQGKVCAYSFDEGSHDRSISPRMLFDGSTEIDHIYPLSISLDDSQMNKVLCMRAENMQKGQRTPWQAWRDSSKFEHILRRFDRTNLPAYPPAKLRRLKDSEFDAGADFAAAQLNDTRYICVAVRNYLATLGYDDSHLQVSRGQMTAELRRLWGLVDLLPKELDDIPQKASVDVETGEIVQDAESKKAEVKKKDRGDHRHHAIDAIVTALVDGRVFQDLMRRYRWREDTGSWPEQPLDCPVSDLRQNAERIVLRAVVSHASRRKILGGLHEELPYGLGVYVRRDVPVTPIKRLLAMREVVACDPDGSPGKSLDDGASWIENPISRDILRDWFAGYDRADKARRREYPLPMFPDGATIKIVNVSNRCYVKRIGIERALEYVENDPGRKTWIVDQSVRGILKEWLVTHAAKSAIENPPRMRRLDGDVAHAAPIRKVRVATWANGLVRFAGKPQIFAKGSNHHVAIFKRALPDGSVERRGVFVDMLEAARRARDLPIFRTDCAQLLATEPGLNLDSWRFEMALCAQDMVLWDEEDVPADQRILGQPVYRLQKMSGANNSLIFRHHTVTSTSDTDGRGVIRRSPNSLHCRKIQIGAIGQWEIVGGD